MSKLFTLVSIGVGSHLVGSAVFSGVLFGLPSVLLSPLLSIFGWFLVLPEIAIVGIQWRCYRPKRSGLLTLVVYIIISIIIVAPLSAIFGPKEDGKGMLWAVAYAAASSTSMLFNMVMIHFIKKRNRHEAGDGVAVGGGRAPA